ncbi:hypothetical protein [Owenweeksia hongkongensis]|uniref:hypothetical protein n=1 Tax=Owenweeksia hongkongensis TaxID=253245 RepID=UPI003A93A505
MKNYIVKVCSLVMAMLVMGGCASTPVYTSKDTNNLKESPSPFVDQDSKILYWAQHDSKNLYITFATSDPSSQRQILMQGISVWFDEAGRKREYLGFTYPAKDPHAEGGRPPMNRGEREPMEASRDNKEMARRLMQQFQSRISYIELHGFLEEGSFERLNYRLEKGPVKVDISMNEDGELLYKVKIPLTSIFTEEGKTSRLVSVGVEGNSEQGNKPSGPPSGGVQMGGGGPPGGGQGGGQGGGRRPGQGGDDMDSSSGINFWFKVLL